MKQIKAPSHLPRNGQDDLGDLKESIREHGQLQPILIDAASGRVIVGERRRRALQALRVKPKVIEVKVGDKAAELAMRLSEEVSKRDIPRIERAEAAKEYAELVAKVADDGHLDTQPGQQQKKTTSTVGEGLDISRAEARRLLQIAALPAEAKKAASDGDVGTGALNTIVESGFTSKQKGTLVVKVAKGKMPNTAKGMREVITYVKDADSAVKAMILDRPTASFEDAQRTARNLKDTARRKEQKDKGLPFVWFVHKMIGKLNDYSADLAALHDIASQIPDHQRAQLVRAIEKQKKQLDRWLTTLEGKTALPPNGDKMRRVLEKAGGEWTEVEIGG